MCVGATVGGGVAAGATVASVVVVDVVVVVVIVVVVIVVFAVSGDTANVNAFLVIIIFMCYFFSKGSSNWQHVLS